MSDKLVKEYIERVGVVTPGQLAEQMGAARSLWQKPVVSLMMEKEIFFCRLAHGEETFLSRHLLFCLRTVYTEPELGPEAQAMLDWLSDNEPAVYEALAGAALPDATAREAESVFGELQRKLCVAPLVLKSSLKKAEMGAEEAGRAFSACYDFTWVTVDYWLKGLYRPAHYRDLEYCISEIRAGLKRCFTTRELDALIYRGAL